MRNLVKTETADEAHISSVIIQCRPDSLDSITDRIKTMAGAEIHISNPEGKLIVSLETASLQQVTDRIEDMSRLPGVLSAVLVYHQVDHPDLLDEIIEV